MDGILVKLFNLWHEWITTSHEGELFQHTIDNVVRHTKPQLSCKRQHSISQEICTRFCCALFCCGYAIVHIMNSHEVFIHIHQGCFAGTGAIVRLPPCQWSKPDGYGEISQCITTTKHSKAKTVCIFLGIYCRRENQQQIKLVNKFFLLYRIL